MACSLNFELARAQKGLFCLPYWCCIKHKKTQTTDLSLETRSEINFEFGKFVNCLPFTKQIGNMQGLVILDLSRFSITFFYQISQTYQHIVRTVSRLEMFPR